MIWIILGVAVILILIGIIVVTLFFSGSNDEGIDRGEGINSKYSRGLEGGVNRAPADPPMREPASPTGYSTAAGGIGDASVGDWLRVSGAGDHQSDLDFQVSGSVRYSSDRENWTEYSGSYHGREVAVEMFDDDAGEVGLIVAEETITLEQLGLTEDNLIEFDESGGLPFDFDGSTWEFVWSGEVTYRENGSFQQEGFYGWDFAEQGGPRMLCVEKREQQPFEVNLMQLVDAERVRMLRN